MKTQTSGHEKAVGWILVSGGVLLFVSLVATWLCFAAGVHRAMATRDPITDHVNDVGTANLVPLTLTFAVIGILIVVGGLLYGASFNRNPARGAIREVDHVRILAKFGTDRSGNLIGSDFLYDTDDRVRFYVRAVMPTGVVDEFEVHPDLFWQCGEGMTGRATLQGKWLGGFIPYIGAPVQQQII